MLKVQPTQQQTIQRWEADGMVVKGHIDFGNGFHGRRYLTSHVEVHDPYRVMQIAQDLVPKIPRRVWAEIDIVVGAITGGAILANDLAVALDVLRGPMDRRVKFAPIYKRDGKLAFRKFYKHQIFGKKVMIVDDIIHTGRTAKRCAELVEEVGGKVIVFVFAYDLLQPKVDLPRGADYFVHEEAEFDTDIFPADSCPMCQAGEPITEF